MEKGLTKEEQIAESEILYLDKIRIILDSDLSNKDKLIAIRRKCGSHHYKEFILLNHPKD